MRRRWRLLPRRRTSRHSRRSPNSSPDCQRALPVEPPTPPTSVPVLLQLAPEPQVGEPERDDGDPETCDAFMVNCSLLFSLQPCTFTTKAAYLGCLHHHAPHRTGVALGNSQMGAPVGGLLHLLFFCCLAPQGVRAGELPVLSSMSAVGTPPGREVCVPLLASRRKWSLATLVDTFLHRLAAYIKDALVLISLCGAIDLAIRVDLQVQAVKLALEEWRQWPEGAELLFFMWTDHRNLEYIRMAKRLTPSRLSGHCSSHVLTFPFLPPRVVQQQG